MAGGDPAFTAALRTLARRDHSRRELVQKLRAKGFHEDEVARAVEQCEQRGYLDDRRYAERFVQLRAAQKGWVGRRLIAELERRGVDRQLAEKAAVLSEAEHERALDAAIERAERRLGARWWTLPNGRERLLSSLVGRGLDTADAIAVVDRLLAERGIDDASPDE